MSSSDSSSASASASVSVSSFSSSSDLLSYLNSQDLPPLDAPRLASSAARVSSLSRWYRIASDLWDQAEAHYSPSHYTPSPALTSSLLHSYIYYRRFVSFFLHSISSHPEFRRSLIDEKAVFTKKCSTALERVEKLKLIIAQEFERQERQKMAQNEPSEQPDEAIDELEARLNRLNGVNSAEKTKSKPANKAEKTEKAEKNNETPIQRESAPAQQTPPQSANATAATAEKPQSTEKPAAAAASVSQADRWAALRVPSSEAPVSRPALQPSQPAAPPSRPQQANQPTSSTAAKPSNSTLYPTSSNAFTPNPFASTSVGFSPLAAPSVVGSTMQMPIMAHGLTQHNPAHSASLPVAPAPTNPFASAPPAPVSPSVPSPAPVPRKAMDFSVLPPLRRVHIPSSLPARFMEYARSNTEANIETCAILTGQFKNNELYITHVILPPQSGTSDTCVMSDEEKLMNIQLENDLITGGWIHTHPSQTCFLSSIDLHTHYSYQLLLAEAIAIVMAPTKIPSQGVFNCTPAGLQALSKCKFSGFHQHAEKEPLYTAAQHCVFDNSDAIFIDLREPPKATPQGGQSQHTHSQPHSHSHSHSHSHPHHHYAPAYVSGYPSLH